MSQVVHDDPRTAGTRRPDRATSATEAQLESAAAAMSESEHPGSHARRGCVARSLSSYR
jgi:hypothetical protein